MADLLYLSYAHAHDGPFAEYLKNFFRARLGDAVECRDADEIAKDRAAPARSAVTLVLAGPYTFSDPKVGMEITRSHEMGIALLAIHVPGGEGRKARGINPLDLFTFRDHEGRVIAYPCHDWEEGHGEENFPAWLKRAYQDARERQRRPAGARANPTCRPVAKDNPGDWRA